MTTPLNKAQLAEGVADQTGLTLDEAYLAVTAVLDVITETVTTGRDVSITNFGTFRHVVDGQRTARNPQTGEPVLVPARPTMRFRAAPRLRNVVASGDPTASIHKRPKSR